MSSRTRFGSHRVEPDETPILLTRARVLTRPLRQLRDFEWRYPFTDQGRIEEGLRTEKRY